MLIFQCEYRNLETNEILSSSDISFTIPLISDKLETDEYLSSFTIPSIYDNLKTDEYMSPSDDYIPFTILLKYYTAVSFNDIRFINEEEENLRKKIQFSDDYRKNDSNYWKLVEFIFDRLIGTKWDDFKNIEKVECWPNSFEDYNSCLYTKHFWVTLCHKIECYLSEHVKEKYNILIF